MFLGTMLMTTLMVGIFPYLLTVKNIRQDSKNAVSVTAIVLGIAWICMIIFGK